MLVLITADEKGTMAELKTTSNSIFNFFLNFFFRRYGGSPSHDGNAGNIQRQVDVELVESRWNRELESGPVSSPAAHKRDENGRNAKRRTPTEEVPVQNVPSGESKKKSPNTYGDSD